MNVSVASKKWTSHQFRVAFENVAIPVTTANHQLIRGWKVEDVWESFWATIQDFYRHDKYCSQVLDIVMESSEQISTRQQRRKLKSFVAENIPGYQAIFESEILPAINSSLESEGLNERVLGFRYGKDGRGAMPDRYYQLLLKKKYLVVGNHHDILGHFILFCDPVIREVTEGLAREFSTALEFQHTLASKFSSAEEFNRRTVFLRRALRLYTLSWNIIQEKLYLRLPEANGRSILNLVGAFNSVYNALFSDSLAKEKARDLAGALGFFHRDPLECILLSPKAMREYCTKDAGQVSAADLRGALDRYEAVWEKLGLGEVDTSEFYLRFEEIVLKTLLERKRYFSQSFRQRWESFSEAILGDVNFGRLFDKPALLSLAEAMLEVAHCLFERERDDCCFINQDGNWRL